MARCRQWPGRDCLHGPLWTVAWQGGNKDCQHGTPPQNIAGPADSSVYPCAAMENLHLLEQVQTKMLGNLHHTCAAH